MSASGLAMGPPTDAALVAGVRAGEDSAFEELYRRYRPRVNAFVRRLLRDDARAEDVTQEAFLSALRRIRVTDRQIAFKPWIYEIARNAAIDAHRRSRRSEEVSMDAVELLRPSDRLRLLGPAPLDSTVVARERLRNLRGALTELSDTHHRVLVMRELEGRSYREIAERMDLTRPAVESTLFRARRRLKRVYAELERGRRLRRRRAKAAALLPLPALLRPKAARGALGPASAQGGQALSSLAERAAALLAAAALASAGATFIQERLVPGGAARPSAADMTSDGFGVPRLVLPSTPSARVHRPRRAKQSARRQAVPAGAAAEPVHTSQAGTTPTRSAAPGSISLPSTPLTDSESIAGAKATLESRATSEVDQTVSSAKSAVKAVKHPPGLPTAVADSVLENAKRSPAASSRGLPSE